MDRAIGRALRRSVEAVPELAPGQSAADARAAIWLEARGYLRAASELRQRARRPRAWWTPRRVALWGALADIGADLPLTDHPTNNAGITLLALARYLAPAGLRLWTERAELSAERTVAVQRAAVALLEQVVIAELSMRDGCSKPSR